MNTEQVQIKSKGEIIGEFDYEFPASLEEALEVDGEDKIYKLYVQKRKINFMDAKRRELTGGGLPKQITAALKSADPEVIAKIAEQLGVEL